MGAEAETMRQTVANGKVTDGAEKMSIGSVAGSKPVGGRKVLTDDDIESTLAAASEKLQAAHRRDQKVRKKKGVARFFGALYPMRILTKFRDAYINTCVMAAEKGDFVDMVAGHPGMYYGESILSRDISQRRDRENDEVVQASLSRQVSVSLSRQMSKQKNMSGPLVITRNPSTGGIQAVSRTGSPGTMGLHRNASTGMPGLNRQTSTGIAGLNRNTSTGVLGLSRHTGAGRTTFGRSLSSRKPRQPNLFSEGREKFLQDRANDLSNIKAPTVNTIQNRKVASVPELETIKLDRLDAPGVAAKTYGTTRPFQ